MKNRTEEEQRILDWDNELRFNSTDYSDAHVVDIAQKAIEYAYKHFKEKELIYEDFQFMYEAKIANVALGIESYLQKNTRNKKSLLIKQFVMNIINEEKYSRGRSRFFLLLYKLKMDNELRKIAAERKDFWNIPRIDFDLLYALYKRKIKGFTENVNELIINNPKETDIKKYATKYIEQEKTWI